jgi:hypothetical protein
MIFRISAAAELVVFAAAKTTRTASPSQDCQPLGWPWDSLNAQAPLAKIDIRSKIRQLHYNGAGEILAAGLILKFSGFAGGRIRKFLALI